MRKLTEIHVVGQTTATSFGGASVARVVKMMELQNDDWVDTLILLIGTNDVSRIPVAPEAKWEPLLVCLLNELKENYRPRLAALCTIPLNADAGSPIAAFMNRNVTRWNTMVRNLIAEKSNELRLMDTDSAVRMVDHSALTRIHFNTQQGGRQWICDAFQTKIEEMEAELQTMVNPMARGSPAGMVRSRMPQPLASRLGPLATEANVTQPAPSSDVRERDWGPSPLPEAGLWRTDSGQEVLRNR